MSDKCSFRIVLDKVNKHEQAMMRQASAYNLLMKKQKEEDITMWFTDEFCTECNCPIYTSERPVLWYKEGCVNNGRRGADDKDYMKFIKENCR